MVSCRAPYPIFRVLDSEKRVLQGLEQIIKGFRAAITKKKRIFGQKWPKKAIFWPKTVFLGPEWSQVGPHTIFRGCWTQKNVFCSLLEQMIKGSGASITKKPYFLPKTNMYGLSYTKAAIRN